MVNYLNKCNFFSFTWEIGRDLRAKKWISYKKLIRFVDLIFLSLSSLYLHKWLFFCSSSVLFSNVGLTIEGSTHCVKKKFRVFMKDETLIHYATVKKGKDHSVFHQKKIFPMDIKKKEITPVWLDKDIIKLSKRNGQVTFFPRETNDA